MFFISKWILILIIAQKQSLANGNKIKPGAGCAGANEVYNECGSACPLTCGSFKKPLDCIDVCVKGCFCDDAFIRDEITGGCVAAENCTEVAEEQKCPVNEKYSDCGTSCQLTCKNYKTPPPCILRCVQGCFCEKGFVRDDFGKCVPEKSCAVSTCGKNQTMTNCGSACPLTCDNYHNPPNICPEICIIGCICNKGYVKDTTNGNCVLPQDCPSKCPPNESFSDCGTACPLTCNNFKNAPLACNRQCVQGCFCNVGLVRDAVTGKCISPNKCPGVCPANQFFNECGTACPLTCENYKSPPKFCTLQCVIGCACSDGFVKDTKTGTCVRPENCPGHNSQQSC